MIVANLVQQAVGRDDNEAVIHDEAGAHPLPRLAKDRLARAVVDHAIGLAASQAPKRRALRPVS